MIQYQSGQDIDHLKDLFPEYNLHIEDTFFGGR